MSPSVWQRLWRGGCILTAAVCLSGCFSLQDKQPVAQQAPQPAAAKALAEQKKQELQKKSTPDKLPETLGGAITSDRWVIYKEKQEEEFKGNVHYDNGIYAFRADYALSQRKQNLFTAKGNVFARYNAPDGAWYELYAEKAAYNYQTGKGYAQSAAPRQIKLVYQTTKGDLITAYAQKADFNTKEETYVLSTNVRVIYQGKDGQRATLKAQRMTAKQKENYALLQGGAEAANADYNLKAQTIEYKGLQGYTYAYGGRPLLEGKTEDGTFAIIADKVTAENTSRNITLSGKVEGWTVSKQINASKANESLGLNYGTAQ